VDTKAMVLPLHPFSASAFCSGWKNVSREFSAFHR